MHAINCWISRLASSTVNFECELSRLDWAMLMKLMLPLPGEPNGAIVRIQALHRGITARKVIGRVRAACGLIQALHRGNIGRKLVAQRREELSD